MHVYILQSAKHHRYYTGISRTPDERLKFHNLRLNTSTQNGVPWHRIWLSDELAETDARALETKIKKRGAARFLKELKLKIEEL